MHETAALRVHLAPTSRGGAAAASAFNPTSVTCMHPNRQMTRRRGLWRTISSSVRSVSRYLSDSLEQKEGSTSISASNRLLGEGISSRMLSPSRYLTGGNWRGAGEGEQRGYSISNSSPGVRPQCCEYLPACCRCCSLPSLLPPPTPSAAPCDGAAPAGIKLQQVPTPPSLDAEAQRRQGLVRVPRSLCGRQGGMRVRWRGKAGWRAAEHAGLQVERKQPRPPHLADGLPLHAAPELQGLHCVAPRLADQKEADCGCLGACHRQHNAFQQLAAVQACLLRALEQAVCDVKSKAIIMKCA